MPDNPGGTEGGTAGAPPATGDKSEWWASPAVVGLMGFGTTTMIAGLSNLPDPYDNGFYGNWVVFGMALAFGGIAQLIAGLIGLRKGNLFAGSAFVGYGSFWIAFALMLSSFVVIPKGATPPAPYLYGVAGFAFIWMLFTFSFMINSIKHGWGITFVFVFLFISFVLLVVKFWSLAASGGGSPFAGSGADNWIVGGMIIATGFIAWYVATAILTNWNYGRKILPE
ncbi:MAG TPA: acetate uptake transporter [Thermoplasmata archaeon]|nr:acetate uptake transporter [Thermoplasmata archaeon]